MWVLPLLVTIVATAEVKGTPEPCGCTSDPLGDVARVATLAKDGLWVDAGSLSYDHEQASPERRAQADATAAALGRIYAGAEVGLGADDLVRGPTHVSPARHACNLRGGGVPTVAPRVRVVQGVRVGVFGVATPARLPGLKASPPVPAATKAVAQLRKQGAQLIVALCGMDRPETRALVRAVPGIDVAVIGAEVGDGLVEPEAVGDSFLVAPADQARYAAKLEIEWRTPGKLAWFGGETAQKRQLDKSTARIGELQKQLAEWKKDPTADAQFVQARQTELDQLLKEHAALAQAKLVPPTGNWFSYALVPVTHKIARDPGVAKELTKLAHDIGQANFRAARDVPAPPAEPGEPTYVGVTACASCHKAAVDFWKQTVHAQAWKTLVDVDKQYNFDCIRCHVTGWETPGGVNLGTAEKRGLVDVQCEVCHGPGSIHVKEAGLEDKRTLVRRPPDDFCVSRCHTKEHSDTFALVPYLRDILGKGHGEKARAQLGDGVTGHELRKRALEAAGR
jgi:hypothetical protein